LAPMVLAVIGAASHPNRSTTSRLVVLVLAAGVFAAGKQLGLYSLAYALLPGMERFRVPARTLFLASLGISGLAGAGVDRLLMVGDAEPDRDRLRKRIRNALLTITALVIAGACVGVVTTAPGRQAHTTPAAADRAQTSSRELRALAAVA